MSLRYISLASALAILTIAALWSGTASAAPAEVAACPLLTADEIAAALGEPLVAVEQDPMGGGEKRGAHDHLHLDAPRRPRADHVSDPLVLAARRGPGAARFIEAFRTIAEEYPDLPTPEPIGIGDEALWDGTGVHVRKGDMSFSLSTSLNALDDTPDAKAKMQGLAEIVAGRL